MKNSIFLAIVIIAVSCNKDPKKDDVFTKTSTGNAFVLKDAFIDSSSIIKENYLDTSIQTFIDENNNPYTDTTITVRSKFFFDLNIDFAWLNNFELSPEVSIPSITYFDMIRDGNFWVNAQHRSDIEDGVVSLSQTNSTSSLSNYNSFIVMNSVRDANPMYFASLGFFLEQFIEKQQGGDLKIGYFSPTNKTIEVEENKEDLMTNFYERTKTSSKNSLELIDYIPASELLDQIELGIQELDTTSPATLTILTYTLFDTSFLDTNRLNSIQAQLKGNIQLNIISLYPVDFMQKTVFRSGGFLHHDIYKIYDIPSELAQPYQFEELVNEGYFSSSIVVQNTNLLIEKISPINRFSVKCVLTDFNDITKTKAISEITNTSVTMFWQSSEKRLPVAIYLNPEIR